MSYMCESFDEQDDNDSRKLSEYDFRGNKEIKSLCWKDIRCVWELQNKEIKNLMTADL